MLLEGAIHRAGTALVLGLAGVQDGRVVQPSGPRALEPLQGAASGRVVSRW